MTTHRLGEGEERRRREWMWTLCPSLRLLPTCVPCVEREQVQVREKAPPLQVAERKVVTRRYDQVRVSTRVDVPREVGAFLPLRNRRVVHSYRNHARRKRTFRWRAGLSHPTFGLHPSLPPLHLYLARRGEVEEVEVEERCTGVDHTSRLVVGVRVGQRWRERPCPAPCLPSIWGRLCHTRMRLRWEREKGKTRTQNSKSWTGWSMAPTLSQRGRARQWEVHTRPPALPKRREVEVQNPRGSCLLIMLAPKLMSKEQGWRRSLFTVDDSLKRVIRKMRALLTF
mmetsp:Transcript_18380/g.46091  ORF Transcript_18380/g.46091 Transcript_18380/m.46091 type:complete len:283 (-) Transcript_18380:686-1534(-)